MNGEIEKFANDILDIVKNTFCVSPILPKQRNGRINFFHYFRFGFQEEELYAFLKTRFCNPAHASNQTHFWSKGDTKSVYMSTGCQLKLYLKKYICHKTWIWSVSYLSTNMKYIFLYFLVLISIIRVFSNSPVHLVRLYTIKFYSSNLNIANHNLCF